MTMDLATARLVKLASAKLSTTDAETVAFDFGTPNDINLAGTSGPGSGYRAGDRVLVLLNAVRDAGTTSTITLVVQDADDSAGSIGTPATAITDGTLVTEAADNQQLATMVKIKANRPWLRISVTNSSATDTVLCYCTVYAIPRSGL